MLSVAGWRGAHVHVGESEAFQPCPGTSQRVYGGADGIITLCTPCVAYNGVLASVTAAKRARVCEHHLQT